MLKTVTLAAVFSITCSSAWAAPITFSFSGAVSEVTTSLASAFSVGDAFDGTMVFDDSAVVAEVSSGRAVYQSDSQAFSATVGNSYSMSGNFYNSPVDGPAGDVTGGDYWRAIASPPAYLSHISGASVNGLPVLALSLILWDPFGNAIDSVALAAPIVANYSVRQFIVSFGNADDPSYLSGSLNTLQPTSVPEPSSLFLAATGLAIVVFGTLHSERRRTHVG